MLMLDNTAENLQAAESRIRDVDMAKEMVKFAKDIILQQAAQSMLAQANQQTQGVLALLQYIYIIEIGLVRSNYFKNVL